ncbi:hypothetical protein GUJ93_ZPchr0006g41527 [Zizania palustris]|uniref:DNA-directed RNA polymerase II subunit RPB9-like zinc ribbon domain-containing protein n=1 Tax=Zizania palustris TaxID=103762 RepID=A0A8J5VEJ5_ZIZPA|nr:hypothetical protein GUJ93_ZPchr0482g33631 [Zizania palustris]KAG8071817.1 hypothetical protein GUJ93_ZPchr0006g41527 [Zizania palustris]
MGFSFCPACGMLLQIQPATGGNRLRFFCPTCPYVLPVKNKEREPIFSGDDAMKFAPKTPPQHDQGATMVKHKQMQIRSVDEPISDKCCKEDRQFEWRDN